MRPRLRKELFSMNEAEFRELGSAHNIAARCRCLMRIYGITKEDMQKRLGLTKIKMTAFVNASYPYDLRIISKLQAIDDELETAKVLKDNQIIKFPPYKDSTHKPDPNKDQ